MTAILAVLAMFSVTMCFRKPRRFVQAQLNKVFNKLQRLDPVAELQLECDRATEQMRQGREGLEQHRGLVERLRRQTEQSQKHSTDLRVKIGAHLATGDRETAGRFALELKQSQYQANENEQQLKLLEQAYENNLLKVQQAGRKIQEVRNRITQYTADLEMSRTEAEIAKLGQSLNFDVSTNFGQVEQLVQEKIDANRAVVRVAADLSGQGMDAVYHDLELEKAQAEEALRLFEADQKPSLPPLESQK